MRPSEGGGPTGQAGSEALAGLCGIPLAGPGPAGTPVVTWGPGGTHGSSDHYVRASILVQPKLVTDQI